MVRIVLPKLNVGFDGLENDLGAACAAQSAVVRMLARGILLREIVRTRRCLRARAPALLVSVHARQARGKF